MIIDDRFGVMFFKDVRSPRYWQPSITRGSDARPYPMKEFHLRSFADLSRRTECPVFSFRQDLLIGPAGTYQPFCSSPVSLGCWEKCGKFSGISNLLILLQASTSVGLLSFLLKAPPGMTDRPSGWIYGE